MFKMPASNAPIEIIGAPPVGRSKSPSAAGAADETLQVVKAAKQLLDRRKSRRERLIAGSVCGGLALGGRGERLPRRTACLLRPNPFCLVTTVGCALHRHRTCCFRHTSCAAFKDARCYTQRFDLRIQTRDLRLENGDLVFFLF